MGNMILSNQLYDSGNVYTNWYKDLKDLDEKLIIKNIFSAPSIYIYD